MAALTLEEIQNAQAALRLLTQFLPDGQAKRLALDAAADAPVAFNAYVAIKGAIEKFPPRAQRTAVSIVVAFGVDPDEPIYSLAMLYDQIVDQVEAEQKAAKVVVLPPGKPA